MNKIALPMNKISTRILYTLLTVCCMLSAGFRISAFPLASYTDRSVLADGRWVKVSVSQTGMHFISNATLRSWGFTDASKVSVHGYGGSRVPEYLDQDIYRDDLPQTAVYRSASGIYFYAKGPDERTNYLQRTVQDPNPYTTLGYYFITDSRDEVSRPASAGAYTAPSNPATTFNDLVVHENDLVSISQSGRELYGEDFRHTPSRSFKFSLTDRVDESSVWMRTVFVTATNQPSTIDITANGKMLSGARIIGGKATNFGVKGSFVNSFGPDNNNLTVGITFKPNGVVSAAHLDAININYMRRLRLDGGRLGFELNQTGASLSAADESTHVWDVTDPEYVVEMTTSLSGDNLTWVNPYTGRRSYVAWSEKTSFPSPRLVVSVPNQNLHGISELPDMVIFTTSTLAAEAERMAALHRREPDNFNVLVVNQDYVFNEFSSGSRDPGAFRMMLKMLYDRGVSQGRPVRYAVMFGPTIFDNRRLTQDFKARKDEFMPSWQSAESLSEGGTYTSDDIFGIVDDNTGRNFTLDRIDIAVGRVPASTLAQARTYVDKLYAYADNRQYSEWKNSVLLEADNGNDGIFMEGVEEMYLRMMDDADASQHLFTKVYIDAFNIQNGVATGARDRFNRVLDEGAAWWIYNGHGSVEYIGEEGLHTKTIIEKMNNRHLPVFIGSTCSFGHWDGPETSGLEEMAFNPSGGIIAGWSTSRKAYVSDNDEIVRTMGNHFLRRGEDMSHKRLGDMIRDTKNDLLSGAPAMTKLRFMLLGDPALRPVTPSARVTLDSIGDMEVTPDNQCTIMARQKVTLSGTVRNPDGSPMNDFNGNLSVTLYDAEYSTTSKGLPANSTPGKEVTFEETGHKLFSGRGKVTDGRFTVRVVMPAEVADNFRPATLNMYAYEEGGREAIGINRDFYVFGYDDTAEADTLSPLINYAYLNHSSFAPGDAINDSPMFMASVTDDTGINISMAGIGHQMTIKLDDRDSYNDVSLYFTPSADGSPSGTVAYPLSGLAAGNHTLTFRVWDTSGNSASRTLGFFVDPNAMPQVFDIYTDANPASTHANFYVSHNRPDADATVSLEIYSMAGRRVWASTVEGRSDLFLSTPIQWNLCDRGGNRVPRGIYIYRAVIKIDGHELQTSAKRIAVTGR